jgi:hypothetical protein
MSATSRAWQSADPSELPPGSDDCEWVSDLLRSAADTEKVRHAIMGTLSIADLWCIWRGTKHGATKRDRRSHRSARLELERRGLLDVAGQPVAAGNWRECPDST